MQRTWQQAAIPPWGSSLITQRSQPTPVHFLPDLPQESRACWVVDHTCWSQTILLPVPDQARDPERETHTEWERESPGFYLPLAVLTSFTLTLSLCLSLLFISLLTIHPSPAPLLGTKYSLAILFQTSSHTPPNKDDESYNWIELEWGRFYMWDFLKFVHLLKFATCTLTPEQAMVCQWISHYKLILCSKTLLIPTDVLILVGRCHYQSRNHPAYKPSKSTIFKIVLHFGFCTDWTNKI